MGKLDLAIIILLGIMLLFGMAKGFVKQILSFANWLVALIAAFALVKPVSTALMSTSLYTTVNTKVAEWIAKSDAFNVAFDYVNSTGQLSDAMSSLGLPKFIADIIAKGIDFSEVVSGLTLAEVLSPTISSVIVTIITFLALFILTLIILKIVTSLINSLFKGAILGFVNKILGGALGLVKGLIIVSLLMLLISVMAGVLPSINTFVTEDLANSTVGIAKYFYENNPIIKIIQGSFDFDSILDQFGTLIG